MKKNYLSTFCGLLFFSLGVTTNAQVDLDLPIGEKLVLEKANRLSHFTTDLYRVIKQSESTPARELSAFLPKEIRIEEERILIDVIAIQSAKALSPALAAIGFEQTAAYGKIVTGWMPIDELVALERVEGLKYVRPCYIPIKSMGSVHSQGDSAQYSKLSRTEYGYDGAGLKIGILSDSYNTLSGEAAGVSSGDLPGVTNPNGYTTPVTIVQDYSSTGSDEARGMAEIIHDVAPGAALYARTAFEGEADFAQGILDLEALGCDVIVDDVGYFAEPFFQDGVIAQAVDEVVANGAVYYSAAGNSGRNSYESAFEDSGFTLSSKPIHDFDPGPGVDYAQELTIPGGATLTMTFQWNQPFGSLPNSVADCASDMDLFLYNSSFTVLLATGSDNNITTGDPLEILSYQNTSAGPVTVQLIIQHFSGLAPTNMKYVIWSTSPIIEEYDTESSTIVGHANATDAIACGAAAWYNTTAYGAASTEVNSFSSAGGTPILFDKVGNPITSVTRLKPEVVGPDGANTTFFGTDITQDTDSYPNFFGTSASAPHLAGLGAMLLQAGAVDQSEVLAAMITTSIDLDDPSTGTTDSGFDFGTGYGMVEGKAAIEHVMASLPVELIDFQVYPQGRRNALLNWTTASEVDHQSFVVEWKEESGSFTRIAEVDGKGDLNNLSNYQLIIEDLKSGTQYFRLLQKNWEGRLSSLGVVSLDVLPDATKVWTYQNFENQAIAVLSDSNIEYIIEVYNSEGRLMHSAVERTAMAERKITEWPIGNWNSGIYYYTLRHQGKVDIFHSGKFIL